MQLPINKKDLIMEITLVWLGIDEVWTLDETDTELISLN